MPFLGARTRAGEYQINAKVYGPDNKFSESTNTVLISKVKELADDGVGMNEKSPKEIASRLVKLLSFDPNVAWVECEIIHEKGWSIGDVAIAEEN